MLRCTSPVRASWTESASVGAWCVKRHGNDDCGFGIWDCGLVLLEAVVERENMRLAYKRVVANKGSAGVDGMRVEDLKVPTALGRMLQHQPFLVASHGSELGSSLACWADPRASG